MQALPEVIRQHETSYGKIDDSAAPTARMPWHAPWQPAASANFCKVWVTPEELILDFGMNAGSLTPVRLATRLVMSFTTAKRLVGMVERVIGDHEKRFGNLELDFQKRML
jgi:hypothetical protein